MAKIADSTQPVHAVNLVRIHLPFYIHHIIYKLLSPLFNWKRAAYYASLLKMHKNEQIPKHCFVYSMRRSLFSSLSSIFTLSSSSAQRWGGFLSLWEAHQLLLASEKFYLLLDECYKVIFRANPYKKDAQQTLFWNTNMITNVCYDNRNHNSYVTTLWPEILSNSFDIWYSNWY